MVAPQQLVVEKKKKPIQKILTKLISHYYSAPNPLAIAALLIQVAYLRLQIEAADSPSRPQHCLAEWQQPAGVSLNNLLQAAEQGGAGGWCSFASAFFPYSLIAQSSWQATSTWSRGNPQGKETSQHFKCNLKGWHFECWWCFNLKARLEMHISKQVFPDSLCSYCRWAPTRFSPCPCLCPPQLHPRAGAGGTQELTSLLNL